MKQRGVATDALAYLSVISANAKVAKWEVALELLEEMQSEGIAPNVCCCSAGL